MADEFRVDTRDLEWWTFDPAYSDPSLPYKLDYSYCILGSDRETGKLDMLIRFGPNGYCGRHRHIGPTTTLVIEGEQHLYVHAEDGSVEHRVRKAGEHALSLGGDVHLEGGGPEGGLVLLSMMSRDGHLFDQLDEEGNVVTLVTHESLENQEGLTGG